MREVFVVGAGMTRFGKHLDRSLRDLGFEACLGALQDACVTPDRIEAGYCGNALGSALQGETGAGAERLLGSGHQPHSHRQCRERLRVRLNGVQRGMDGRRRRIL